MPGRPSTHPSSKVAQSNLGRFKNVKYISNNTETLQLFGAVGFHVFLVGFLRKNSTWRKKLREGKEGERKRKRVVKSLLSYCVCADQWDREAAKLNRKCAHTSRKKKIQNTLRREKGWKREREKVCVRERTTYLHVFSSLFRVWNNVKRSLPLPPSHPCAQANVAGEREVLGQ